MMPTADISMIASEWEQMTMVELRKKIGSRKVYFFFNIKANQSMFVQVQKGSFVVATKMLPNSTMVSAKITPEEIFVKNYS